MRGIKISLIISIILFSGVASAEDAAYVSHICDQGCDFNQDCNDKDSNAPYLCKRDSLWPWSDKCVAKGYDWGFCGNSRTEGGGFLDECDMGCYSQDKLDVLYGGDCRPYRPGKQECGDQYCCRKAAALKSNKCVPKGYDYGGCGGPTGQTLTWLEAVLKRDKTPCTSKVKWEIQESCAGKYKDISANCEEGNYNKRDFTVNAGESNRTTCSNKEIPPKRTGPHCARITWCSDVQELRYGAPERVKCWNGGEGAPWKKYLSIGQDHQTDKFCKCVTGEYGAEGYHMEDIVSGWNTNKYVDTRDNEIWVTEDDCCRDRAIIYVICRDNTQILHPVDKDYYRTLPTKKPFSSVKIQSLKNNQKLVEGGKISLRGNVDGGEPDFTYTWNIDGEIIKTITLLSQDFTFYYDNILSLGSHEIKLSVRDNAGETKEDQVTITIVEKPLDLPLKLGDEKGGDDETDDDGLVWAALPLPIDRKTKSSIDMEDIVSREIDWGEGKGFESIDSNRKEANHYYATTSIKKVEYRYQYYMNVLYSSTDTIDVKKSGLSAVINSPKNNDAFFEGDPVKFTGSVHGGTPDYTYTWSINGDTKTIGPTSDTTVSFERNDISTGKYTVSLDVSDANSNRADESVIIYIPTKCKDGGRSRVPCYVNVLTFEQKWINVIDVCGCYVKPVIKNWIFSDSTLTEQISNGKYDDSVTKIFNKVWTDICKNGNCVGGDSCEDYTTRELLTGEICAGVCCHWSGVLVSLIRSLGVPEDKVYWADFKTPNSAGHVVTVYKSDGGTWWVLDLTCCHRIVPVKEWKSICGDCTCTDIRYGYGNDYGHKLWKNKDMFDGMCKDVKRAPK